VRACVCTNWYPPLHAGRHGAPERGSKRIVYGLGRSVMVAIKSMGCSMLGSVTSQSKAHIKWASTILLSKYANDWPMPVRA
jgi:hypothetical protein